MGKLKELMILYTTAQLFTEAQHQADKEWRRRKELQSPIFKKSGLSLEFRNWEIKENSRGWSFIRPLLIGHQNDRGRKKKGKDPRMSPLGLLCVSFCVGEFLFRLQYLPKCSISYLVKASSSSFWMVQCEIKCCCYICLFHLQSRAQLEFSAQEIFVGVSDFSGKKGAVTHHRSSPYE